MLGRILVHQKRLDIEGVGPGLGVGETIFGLEPGPVAALRGGGDQNGLALEVLEPLHVLMGDQHLWILLEHRGHRGHGNAALAHLHHLQIAGAHDTVGLTGSHHLRDIDLGAAHLDADFQTMLFVQPCGHGLVEATMLGLGIPVGHVDEFFLGVAEAAQTTGQHGRAGQGFEEFGSLHRGGSPKV